MTPDLNPRRTLARIDRWPRSVRAVVKTAVDAVLLSLAFAAACLLDLGTDSQWALGRAVLTHLPVVVALKVLTFSYFGMGRDLWRYAGLSDLVRLMRVVLLSSGVVAACAFLLGRFDLPRSILVVDAALTLILTGGARFAVRWLREMPQGSSLRRPFAESVGERSAQRVLVVGAGHAGETMVRELRRRFPDLHLNPVGFVDDDPAKQGMFVHGLPVLGRREDIPRLAEEQGIERIVLCLPSVSGPAIRDIMRACRATQARIDIVPRLEEILAGRARISDLRAVRIEDLLGREKIEFNLEQICSYVQGRRILVTGAGGSIGSELCRQIVRFGPSELVLFGRGENSIFAIANELGQLAPGVPRHQIIGDVINRHKLDGVYRSYRPEIVFHAGADKHVPLMETNPDEAVLNNIIGTRNVLEVGEETGTALTVVISTDKAVEPTSVMGCCKRVAEMLVQSRNGARMVGVAVRFGNVLESRGSVIPLFREQIERGGPVTVTHREVERYFMTIPEAVALVIQAGALGRGGEVFLLDMGAPVRIADLARDMIRLAGFEPDKDITVQFTGLRPGEKLREALSAAGESVEATEHPKILRIPPRPIDAEALARHVADLRRAAIAMDVDSIIELLARAVPSYAPARDGLPVRAPVGGTTWPVQ